MKYTVMKVLEIKRAVGLLEGAQVLDSMTKGRYYERAVAAAERGLDECLTPITTLVIMERNGDTVPVLWCPDASWAREYLEHAANPGLLSVWEVSREEPAPKDITLDFCEAWMNDVADWHGVPADEFLSTLPEFVQEHYGNEAQARRNRPVQS